MSSPEVSFVLASKDPRNLAEFYSYAVDREITAGFDASHYLIYITNQFKIQFYLPSQSKACPTKGRSLAICLEKKPSKSALNSISQWSLKLIEKGAKINEGPITRIFGVETWMIDPEGNEFLIVVPFIKELDPLT